MAGSFIEQPVPTPDSRKVIVWNLQMGNQSRPFSVFDTLLGKAIPQEVFSGKSYPIIPIAGPVQTILDVGANVGAATIYFALHFPQARIFSFEPSLTCHALLRQNTSDLPNIHVFPFGLSDRTALVPLFLGTLDEVTNSVNRSPLTSTSSVQILLRETAEVLREQGITEIDLLKIDTEGCEVPILRSLAPWLPRIGLIYLEFHAADDRLEIDRMLSATHVLCRAVVNDPHRGELCYIDPRRVHASSPWRATRITPA